MCCRIFNSTAADFPVTGRNMNWMWSFDTFLYSTPQHLIKQGLSDSYCQNEGLEPSQVFTWQSTYASISTIIYGEHVEQKKSISSKVAYRGFEYACADGMNEAGLTVNALADTNSEFGTPSDSDKQLSTLRWAQYILDSFATVAEAIIALQSPKYVLVDQGMPDASNKKGLFHMCLSDPSGDSAIVEYVNGEPVIYCDAQYRVVTNQPDYATQLILNNYWQFQWGVSTAHNNHPLQTAPGGHSSTQMFEQASYNLTYSVAQETAILATAQTRNLMGQVAVHLGFNSKKFDDIPLENRAYTIWTNLASTNDLQYYFINTLVGCGGYLEVRNNTRNTYRVKVMNKDKYDQDQFVAYIGDLSGQLEYFDVAPFEHRN